MPASGSSKRIRQVLGTTSPGLSDFFRTPSPKHLNFATAYTMSGRRPPIIRSVNDNVHQDVCSLTKLLEETCIDKTKEGEIYFEAPLECHINGHEAYQQYYDRFEDALSLVFFKAFNDWVNGVKIKGQINLENFKADFDWSIIEDKVKANLGDDFSELVQKFKAILVTSMVLDLATTCNKEGSSLAILLKGKTTTLSTIQQAILQSNIIKAVQTAFASIAEVCKNNLFELNVRLGAMEHEMHRIGDYVFSNKEVIRYNYQRIDAQQKALAITAMETAECKLKLFRISDTFDKIRDMTEQRVAIIGWIHHNPKESVQRYGSMAITPILPRQGQGFVVLTFPSTNDTRHFEGTVSRKRNNKVIPDKEQTQRWSISSSSLLAGDDESIYYIQNTIVNTYNQHME